MIPARAGSKAIPGKNVRILAGRPLLAWSIEAAQSAARDMDVVVSSDSEAYLDVARRWGAVGLLRPAALSTDEATTDSALAHAVRAMAERPDLVVLLQPTVPWRPAGLIDRCVERLLDLDADSLFTARPLPYCWWREDKSGWAEYADWRTNNPQRQRRQDLAPEALRWEEDGSVYVSRTYLLVPREPNVQYPPRRIGGRVQVYPNERTVDINTEEDWRMAEALVASQSVTA